jgi:hypothetical protein
MDPTFDPSAAGSINDFNRLQEFVRDGGPEGWLEYAEELHDCAEVLWQNEARSIRVGVVVDDRGRVVGDKGRISGVSRTYLLLAGLALENVIKGLLVSADASHINTGALSPQLKSHNIPRLIANISDLDISQNEMAFCRLVSAVIPYWGRYPIPLTKCQLMPEVGLTEGDRSTFLDLFGRLAHRLYWEIRDGWDSGVGPQTVKVRSDRYGDSLDLTEKLFE